MGHWLAGIVAGILLYCSFFLYEDEEKAVQNRLVDWRITLDAKAKTILGSHAGILSNSAISTELVKNKIFGRKVWTLQNYFATCCLACLSCYAFAIIACFWVNGSGQLNRFWWFNISPFLLSAMSFLLLLLAPLSNGFKNKSAWWRITVFISSIIFGLMTNWAATSLDDTHLVDLR